MAILGVGVVLVDAAGRILLGHRTKPGEPATWCLPGGAVEAGETFETAGLRELAEETGIALAPDQVDLRVSEVIMDAVDGAPRVSAAVRVQATAETTARWAPRVTEPHVFSSWAWFAPDALPTPLFGATAHVLSRLYGEVVPGTDAPVAAYRVTADR